MSLYKKICKLLDNGAESIATQLGNFIASKLESGDFKSNDDAIEWFKSEEGQKYIHKYVCIGMDILPKRPKKTQAYTIFSRETKPQNLMAGRKSWNELATADKNRYNEQAEKQYQTDVAKFIEMFDGEDISVVAQKKEERRQKTAATKAAKLAAGVVPVRRGKKPQAEVSQPQPLPQSSVQSDEHVVLNL